MSTFNTTKDEVGLPMVQCGQSRSISDSTEEEICFEDNNIIITF